ncbi:MAG TPA: hypothetical protein VJ208_04105 [Candidatus Nanoarchaeia archaeon]|nr:hypothetical protein [Candidatus Nanoarchaeia archaeon]
MSVKGELVLNPHAGITFTEFGPQAVIIEDDLRLVPDKSYIIRSTTGESVNNYIGYTNAENEKNARELFEKLNILRLQQSGNQNQIRYSLLDRIAMFLQKFPV